MIDVADFRHSILMLKEDNKVRLVATGHVRSTIEHIYGCSYRDMFDEIKINMLNNDIITYWINRFCDEILCIYSIENIIINKVKISDLYDDGNNSLHLLHLNEGSEEIKNIIKKAELILEHRLKGCKILNIPDLVIGDMNHKLGLNPFHYTKELYLFKAQCLELLLNSSADQDSIDELIKGYYRTILSNTIYKSVE